MEKRDFRCAANYNNSKISLALSRRDKMFIAGKEIYKFSPVRDDTKMDRVAKYIINQEKHHKKKSFREEYVELLERFKIRYGKKLFSRISNNRLSSPWDSFFGVVTGLL